MRCHIVIPASGSFGSSRGDAPMSPQPKERHARSAEPWEECEVQHDYDRPSYDGRFFLPDVDVGPTALLPQPIHRVVEGHASCCTR
jgi:hypothetical protein